MIKIYNDQARARIRSTVETVERWKEFEPAQRGSNRHQRPAMVILRAVDDIPRNTIGEAFRLETTTGVGSLATSELKIKVYNPGSRIRKNATILAVRVPIPGAAKNSEANQSQVWAVTWHDSATLLIGIANANIPHGSTGVVRSVRPLNGVFTPTQVDAYLPTIVTDVAILMPTWVTWNDSLNRWEVFNSDCT